jgi:glutamine amidotransferase
VCRLFALRAVLPTGACESLVTDTHSLERQSCRDVRGECHSDGWGISYYGADGPHLVRSKYAASSDPRYREIASTIITTTLLAHIRQASVGSVTELNSHPFKHERWTFAHNGTLTGFASDPQRLRKMIPARVSTCIRGETDSEAAFYFVLSLLERAGFSRGPHDVATLAAVVSEAVRTLIGLFPGTAAEPSKLNFVITDGSVLLASRWGHTLFWCERREVPGTDASAALPGDPSRRVVMVASEPTSSADHWREVPDGTILQVDGELRCALTPIFA